MRLHWRLVLPIIGLTLFAGETYRSVRNNHEIDRSSRRYFWWSSIRLDTDPLKQKVSTTSSCTNATASCTSWDLETIYVDPGWLARSLMISALPAFLVEVVVLVGLKHLGVNQVFGFMISMPLFIWTWYYFIGWLIDRRRRKLTPESQGAGAK